MKFVSSIILALTLISSVSSAQSTPIEVVRLNSGFKPEMRQRLIHVYGIYGILRRTSPQTFPTNLYLINLPRQTRVSPSAFLSSYGQILSYVDQQFAIISTFSNTHRDRLAQALHQLSPACGALQALYPETLPTNKIPAAQWLPQGRFGFNARRLNTQTLVQQVQIQRLLNDIKTIESFKTRFHAHPEGRLAGEKIAQMYAKMIPAERKDVTIQLFNHSRTQQKSVIVKILGASAPQEVIVFGSHLDSINPSTNSEIAPGADDNASGTATNMEMFRVLMESGIRPARTIEIHAYAAEEVGLFGSKEIARTYRQNSVQVKAMIQHDMTAYSSRPTNVLTFIENDTDASLTRTLMTLAQNVLKARVQSKPLWAGTSDHYSWNQQGYPASFPFEDPDLMNPHIHSSNDVFAALNNYDQAAQFSRLSLAYIAEFGGI